MKQNKIKIIGNLLTVLSVIFLLSFFRKLDIDVQIFADKKIYFVIITGALLSMVSLMLSALAWKRTIAFFADRKIGYLPAARVYMQANLGKYIPGNMMHFVERNLFAGKAGIGQAEAFAGTFIEIAGQLIAAVILGIFLSLKDVLRIAEILLSLEYIAAIVFLIVIVCVVFRLLYQKKRSFQIICRKIKQPVFWKMLILNECLYMTVLFFLSVLMCVIVCLLSEQSLTINETGKIMTAYILAWMAGFVIPGAPGGLGVREFVVIYLMRKSRMQESILLAMVLHRMITVLGDILGYVWGKVR